MSEGKADEQSSAPQQILEIDSADVVRIMLQFMKENNMKDSMKALSTETGVYLNTVDSVETFLSDIYHGKWDLVLAQVNTMKLPNEKLALLYEQVIFELLETGERALAKEILHNTPAMQYVRANEPERFMKVEHLCRRPYYSESDVYEMGSTKDKRRREVAEALATEVIVTTPSRLLTLLGQALKHQQAHGMIPKSTGDNRFDLFRGSRKAAKRDTEDKYPKKLFGQIKFTTENHPEAAVFSPDGHSLVTGSVDGFIEVWDPESCKLRKDLEYQQKDELMMHEQAVLCACFSKDGELLGTGSQDGKVKVWRLSTGMCLRKFGQAHTQGITSIQFTKDSTQLLTSSYDFTLRMHGLKSGKTLKEFRGHTSYVNTALLIKDGTNMLSASSDGTVKLWDVRTTECLVSFCPGFASGDAVRDLTVHSLVMMPQNPDHILICRREPHAHICTATGQILKTVSSGKETGGDFITATVSPQGKWIYCIGEDGILYVFDSLTGILENILELTEGREVIGMVQHPTRNLLLTMTDDGQLKLWKP